MQASRTSAKPGAGGSTAKDRHRLFLGLALLLAVFAEVTPTGPFGSVSTTITARNDPSAFQQLATFAALAEVAEEEDLDWGSLTRLDRAHAHSGSGSGGSVSPLGRGQPTTTVDAALDSSSDDDGPATPDADPAGSARSSSACTSRRRPHRRQRRRKAAEVSASDTDPSLSSTQSESGCGPSSVASMASHSTATHGGSVHNHRIWTQLHLMEVAYSTRSNNFIHVTERFAEYEQMFPTVYQCALSEVVCPSEAELLANPTTGLSASRYWSCERCGRHHDVVRESCQRCRAPSRFAKLFVGQAVKEVSCAPSLIRLLHATHPHIPVHRAECHADAAQRGKGCASFYVDRANAAELIAKLDRNVFFDADDNTGELFAHYVYTSQQAWLQALAAERVGRASYLPWHPLVVEESKPPQPRGHGPGQKPSRKSSDGAPPQRPPQHTTLPARRGNGEFHHQHPQASQLFTL